jgi:hypothetical protein
LAALAALLLGGVAPAQSPPPPPKPIPLPTTLSALPPSMVLPPLPSRLTASPLPAAPQTAAFQPAPMPAGDEKVVEVEDDSYKDLEELLVLPDFHRLTQLESEASMQLRMQNKVIGNNRKIFPPEPVLSKDKYAGRSWPQMKAYAEPNYVCYHRLLFEQMNLERGGWDLGPITPVVSAFGFFKDVVLLPYHLGTDPFRNYECSAGYCIPGDPTPFLLYPPEISGSGAFAEAAAILALAACFP